jgi:methylated-DNA-[protein]-cysteine S-methyltransferase
MKRDFDRALRGLGKMRAPESLAPRVYARVGIGDTYVRVATGIGDVYVAYGNAGIAAVRRAKDDAAYERWYARRFGRAPRLEQAPDAELLGRLRRHLAGVRRSGLKIDLRGLTAFERAVLEKAREIPRGEVRPYGWVAREIGRPRAVRAVGSALAKNPVPLLIPCHRVVRNDGSVGQYVFGSAIKRALLTSEGAHFRA